jgi:hypothetical protein
MHMRLLPLTCVSLLTLPALSGCGSDELESPTAAQLKAIGKLYLEFAVNNKGNGPANEQEFKRHLRTLPDHVLNSYGLASKALDAPFVSERDQEPLVIRYGIKIPFVSIQAGPLVAHEKTGKNGRRLVAFTTGKAEHVDEARFQELLSAKIEAPPP